MEETLLERITTDSKIMAGKPVIKGTRLTVEYILNLFAHGMKPEEIIAEYEGITHHDLYACLLFASKTLENMAFMPLAMEKV